MEQMITFTVPGMPMSCGEMLNLRLETIAMLKSAGVETLILETCYKCSARHELPLQDLSKTVITAKPNIPTGNLINPNLLRN